MTRWLVPKRDADFLSPPPSVGGSWVQARRRPKFTLLAGRVHARELRCRGELQFIPLPPYWRRGAIPIRDRHGARQWGLLSYLLRKRANVLQASRAGT